MQLLHDNPKFKNREGKKKEGRIEAYFLHFEHHLASGSDLLYIWGANKILRALERVNGGTHDRGTKGINTRL